MGKSKNKKGKGTRNNPTGLPSVKDFNLEQDEFGDGDTYNNSVANIVEKLQSLNVEEKICACSTISTLVRQPKAIRMLLQNNVVKVMGPLIVDSSQQVRKTALGALRNMTVDGSFDVCDKMIEADVLTPLFSLLAEYGEEWSPSDKDERLDIIVQATHLLWNLCESNEITVKRFNQENVLPILLQCMQPQVHGYNLALVVAQCLQTVSEDNPEIMSALSKEATMTLLMDLIQRKHADMQQMLLRVVAAGILYNASGGQLNRVSGSLVTAVVGTLAEALEVDAYRHIEEMAFRLKQNDASMNGTAEGGAMENGAGDGGKDEKKHTKNGLEKELNELECLLTAQRTALEIITNLCCTDDEEEVWEDLDSSDASSDEMLTADVDMEGSDETVLSHLCVQSEVHGAFVTNNLVPRVMCKTNFPSAEVHTILSGYGRGKKLLKSIEVLQSRSLLCVSNMVSGMDIEALGGMDKLHLIWENLSQLALNKQAVESADLLEAVTSAMRATIQKLAEHKSPKFSSVVPSDLQFVFELGQQSSHPPVKANAVRILSTIGCLLAKQMEPHSLLKNIGTFLVEIVSKDQELWVVAEALDAIFDVFAEDHLDPVVREIGLTDKLKAVAPQLKAKIHQQKRSLGDHLPIIMTARTNLMRFIKYKS